MSETIPTPPIPDDGFYAVISPTRLSAYDNSGTVHNGWTIEVARRLGENVDMTPDAVSKRYVVQSVAYSQDRDEASARASRMLRAVREAAAFIDCADSEVVYE